MVYDPKTCWGSKAKAKINVYLPPSPITSVAFAPIAITVLFSQPSSPIILALNSHTSVFSTSSDEYQDICILTLSHKPAGNGDIPECPEAVAYGNSGMPKWMLDGFIVAAMEEQKNKNGKVERALMQT